MANRSGPGAITTPRAKYSQAKAQASYRNEAWNFTFEHWIMMWMKNDYWANKGRGKAQLRMCRLDADKPWAKTNATITKRAGRPAQAVNQLPVTQRKAINRGTGHAAKCRPLMGDHVEYRSIREAARHLNCDATTIRNRLRSPNFPSYYYILGTLID